MKRNNIVRVILTSLAIILFACMAMGSNFSEKNKEWDNELANNGIGKAYLTAGDNEKAMHYFELGMNKEYYSIAFKRYRNMILAENLGWILTGAIVLIVAGFVFKKIKNRKKGIEREEGLL